MRNTKGSRRYAIRRRARMPTSGKSEIDITAAILSRLSPGQLFFQVALRTRRRLRRKSRPCKRCAASALQKDCADSCDLRSQPNALPAPKIEKRYPEQHDNQ